MKFPVSEMPTVRDYRYKEKTIFPDFSRKAVFHVLPIFNQIQEKPIFFLSFPEMIDYHIFSVSQCPQCDIISVQKN